MKVCGQQRDGALNKWRCTRPVGHEGDHIAGIGPYIEGEVILARWPAPARLAYHAHLDVCAQCRENPFDQCATGARLLLAAVDASDRP